MMRTVVEASYTGLSILAMPNAVPPPTTASRPSIHHRFRMTRATRSNCSRTLEEVSSVGATWRSPSNSLICTLQIGLMASVVPELMYFDVCKPHNEPVKYRRYHLISLGTMTKPRLRSLGSLQLPAVLERWIRALPRCAHPWDSLLPHISC